MFTGKRSLCVLICLLLVFMLAACQTQTPPQTTAAETTLPTAAETTDPGQLLLELYNNAVADVQKAENLLLRITQDKTVEAGRDTFHSTANQTLYLSGIGTESFRGSMEEILFMGEGQATFQEYYADGMLYTTVSGAYPFRGRATQEEFMERFAPAIVLDASLYTELTESSTDVGVTLTFQGASQAEAWAIPEYGQLMEASGTALISEEGKLLKSTYAVTYAYSGATITLETEVFVTQESSSNIKAPEDLESYPEISSVTAPRMLTSAVLATQNSRFYSISTNESIISQAAGQVQIQQEGIWLHDKGQNMMALVDIAGSGMSGQEEFSYEQKETYRDGVYSCSEDGAELTPQPGITAEDVQTYCQDTMLLNAPSLENIKNIIATDLNGITYLEITCNEACGEALQDYVCDWIFQDANRLNDLATDYKLMEASGYFALDPHTGLPAGMGASFSCSHTINGYPYLLSYQMNRGVQLGCYDAYEEITEERPETQAPENQATPLFYHVTGKDGQEMWLFGTIHVGDERTSHLPKEIYDAFDASDALAVEFNTRKFEEESSSEENQEMISNAYFYSDGSVGADHVDKKLAKQAEKYLKAGGNYNMNIPYMKISLWANTIDNFFSQQNYAIRSSDGMDNQLLIRAEKMEKPIYDVESAELQINMMCGYSDELQELLLEESMGYHMSESHQGTAELFELWCKGDEDAMRQELAHDDSEMTEEEKKLYDEYITALETDRNVGMLEVAKEYLESGEVVFYAVGLAHLLAEDGLVNTLRDAGYTVELVSYAN